VKPAARSTQQLSLVFDPPGDPRADAPPVFPTPAAGSPPGHPGAVRVRRVALGGDPLDYRLRRARRRTIGFQIDDNGLTVSAPRWVTIAEIESAIAERQRWIRAKFVQWRNWRAERSPVLVRFVEAGELPYLGGTVRLRLRAQAPHALLQANEGGQELWLPLPAEADESRVRDAVQAWLQNEARRVLGARMDALAARLGVQPTGWRLSSARSQWGSCTSEGRIRLNWRLVHFALPVIDYVVAHELAHLKELNHGPRFWQAVADLLPGFEAAREQIRGVDLASLPV
jgi:predicted metal-dependent hydrolase